MITAWRLLKRRFVEHAFDGEGARLFGGRWNSPGLPLVYCSATASLAVLEVFANLQRSDLAEQYVLIECSFDESLVETISVNGLPEDWRRSPGPHTLQGIGDEWIRSGRSAALAVPSAIIEHELNYLLNPEHPDFRSIRRARPKPFVFDLRLVGKP